MPLTPRREVYLDDLLYEMKCLLIAEREDRTKPDAVDLMQGIVNLFRSSHPRADDAVRPGVGYDRPGRPVT